MRDSKFYNSLHLGIVRNLVCVFILLNVNSSFLFADDWKSDSITIHTEVKPDTPKAKKTIDFILIGGAGIANSGTYFRDFIGLAPAFNIGFEIPFSKTHKFALETTYHTWIGKAKTSSPVVDEFYSKVKDGIYSQSGLSFVLKYYLGSVDTKYRFSFHLGAVASDDPETSIDLGFAFYYRVNQNITIQLLRRILTSGFSIEFSRNSTPSYYLLNFCYKF
ncbi:MAG: hypothetical protein KGZ71_03405 [Desulfobulbaceae bacterium]|nr:hypothetical protein [Candidatus Kapabacteria bacterium]MBS3999511.1 hypothetical protein [Desulfobulbaceae bacterium]